MYGVPTEGHLQGQTRNNLKTRLFHTNMEHIYMCSYMISFVYRCRIISCLMGFTSIYDFLHKDGMQMSLEIY